MNSFFAIGTGLLIIGIVNGVIIEKGKVEPFINNDVFRSFTFVYMDGRLTNYLDYCFDISVTCMTVITYALYGMFEALRILP